MRLLGVILIVFGIVALVIGGIGYTKQEQVLDVGPIHATAEHHKTLPLPPVVGFASLAGGIVLVVVGSRTKV